MKPEPACLIITEDSPESYSLAGERIRAHLEELEAKRRRFAERYSWDNIADKFERTLKEGIKLHKLLSKR